MANKLQFQERFRGMTQYWVSVDFPDEFIDRALYRTRDLTPNEIQELNEILIDQCERPPSIVKIVGYASALRARRKHEIKAVGREPECLECDGLGVVRVVSRAGKDLLMRCYKNCRNADYWKEYLPLWKDEFSSAFTKTKVPPNWFIPSNEAPFSTSFHEKSEEWKCKIKISGTQLREHGYF